MIYLILSGLACYKWVKVSQLCCSLEALRPACCKVATKILFANDPIMIFCEEDFQIIQLILKMMKIIRIGKPHVKITVK